VLRGGYGRYFLNPTDQGQNQGFSIQTPLIVERRHRNPLYNLQNPFRWACCSHPEARWGR